MVSRRRFLERIGAAVATTAAGAAILPSLARPSRAQTRTIHWLRASSYLPMSDEVLRRELVPEAAKALGIRIAFETVNASDLWPRAAVAANIGTGPDIVMALDGWPRMQPQSVVDVADIADEIGQSQGGFYPLCTNYTLDGTRQLALPFCVVPSMVAYRKSWFDEIGAARFPETWDEYRDAGRKLKAAGRPLGQTLGHAMGSAAFLYPFLWSWGGKEVDVDGRTVTINSKETIDSIRFMVSFWKEAYDPGGLGWDDARPGPAFKAGALAAILDGRSVYQEVARDPEQYRTERGTPLSGDIAYAPLPAGQAGRFALHMLHSHMVMSHSGNIPAGKALLRWLHAPANYERWLKTHKGAVLGATMNWERIRMWQEDPVMSPYRLAARLGQTPGYPGRASAGAVDAFSRFIVVDMYAMGIQGMPAEDAARWAERTLQRLYR
jgi:multiple sugar transport system substrate-binding protein